MYYNANTNKLRCYENGAWKDCDTNATASLQTAYNNGATITTAGATPIAFTLTSGGFNVSGAGSVNLTPTGASQFTSGGALTLTAGAASTWSTTAGNLILQAGSGTVSFGTSTNLTANAGLTITSGGANALTLNPGGAAALNLGTNNANAVTIGNTTANSVITLQSGTGAINIGTDANAKTISIGTGAVANTINIGNSTGATAILLDAGTGGVKIGDSTATPITNHFSNTAILDFPNLNNSCSNLTVLVPGAAIGDIAIATPDNTAGGAQTLTINWNAWVSANNTVTIRLCNSIATNQNPASQTWRVDVWKH